MTDALHARALVMARVIFSNHYFRSDPARAAEALAGKSDHALELIVAGILATTERAAEGMQSVNRMIGATESQKIALGYAEAEIRTGAHLKEPTS